MQPVYITKIAKFLPGRAISNDEMEDYIGYVKGKKSRAKSLILRNNQIKSRYYAMHKNGHSTHSNAELTLEAIKALEKQGFNRQDIDLLACGTTTPDHLLPSHASMVHGLLKTKHTEYLSAGGSCNAGMLALKHAYLNVLTGMRKNAVCTASEKLSTRLHSKNFEEAAPKVDELKKQPMVAFEKDFLRWMLSDGATASLIQNKPNPEGISLRIEWIEITSFAGEKPVCMAAGAHRDANNNYIPWADLTDEQRSEHAVFALQQDTELLGENIVKLGGDFLEEVIQKHSLKIKDIDKFLPHLSSMFFRKKIAEELEKREISIPQEKWFINLPQVGNVGSASIFLMLEELFNNNKLKKGEKILLMVPESARFAYTFALLTAV